MHGVPQIYALHTPQLKVEAVFGIVLSRRFSAGRCEYRIGRTIRWLSFGDSIGAGHGVPDSENSGVDFHIYMYQIM